MKKRGNFTGWSMAEIEKRHKAGKIKSYSVQVIKPVQIEIGGRIVTKHFNKPKSKEKDFIAKNLLLWCNEHGFQLQEEFRVCKERRWRYDWALPELKIAVEYQGGVFMGANSGHKSPRGFQADIDKANKAQELGWRMIRLSALNYQNLISELNKLL